MKRQYKLAGLAALTLTLISACGGGGGGSAPAANSTSSSSAGAVSSVATSSASSSVTSSMPASSSSSAAASSANSSSSVSSAASSSSAKSSSASVSSAAASSSTSAATSAASTAYVGTPETKTIGYGNAVTGAAGGTSPTKVTVSTLAAAQAAVDAYYGSAGLEITYNGKVDFSSYYDTAAYTAATVKDQEGNVLNAGDVKTCTLHTQAAQILEIKGSSSKPKNNISLIGTDGSSAQFGIHIAAVANNIIIRNMTIGLTPGGDASDIISLEGMSAGIPTNIWIDHNNLFTKNIHCSGAGDTSFDGMIDAKKGVEKVTVSYNWLHDHAKTSLNGFSDSETETRHITFHHNIFENVGSRTPLQRTGYSHMLNNYFTKVATSGINVRMGGYSLVEGNYFEDVQNPVTARDSDAIGYWELRNNNIMSSADFTTYGITWVASGSTSKPSKDATDWTSTASFPTAEMTYTYTPQAAACIKAGLRSVAGAGKSQASLVCQ